MERRNIPAVERQDRFCLHRSHGMEFCYQPTSHVLLRPSDGFAAPVCDNHIQAAQLGLRGRIEVLPLAIWLAECEP